MTLPVDHVDGGKPGLAREEGPALGPADPPRDGCQAARHHVRGVVISFFLIDVLPNQMPLLKQV